MRNFLSKLFLISILFCGILLLLLGGRILVAHNIDWKLPAETHILFLGASQPYRGIDVSMIPGAMNLSNPSERYLYTYTKLTGIVENNPQVDTIFLECSLTDLWQDTDYKYYTENEQSFYVVAYWPLFTSEEWSVFKCDAVDVMSMVISRAFNLTWCNPRDYLSKLGGQANIDDNKSQLDTNTVVKSLELDKIQTYGDYGYEVNYRYLRKIIDLCDSKGIKLYLVGYPLYRGEYFYDRQFCGAMREKYFNDIEFLNYTDLNLSPECRYDAHHLNYKGARVLTQKIKSEILNRQ